MKTDTILSGLVRGTLLYSYKKRVMIGTPAEEMPCDLIMMYTVHYSVSSLSVTTTIKCCTIQNER